MHRVLQLHLPSLGACLFFAGCNFSANLVPNGSGASGGDTSVGDVTGNGIQSNGGFFDSVAGFGAIRARVRNESTARADVTLRFIRGNAVVHLAFVRVAPNTITTVTSPESAEMVELSGIDDRGRALPTEDFVFGVDFTEIEPADYLIREGDGPVETPPDKPAPPVLQLLKPSSATTLPLGSVFEIQWQDSGSASALLSLFIRRAGSNDASTMVSLGPAIGVSLDGINDSFRAVLEGVDPGRYEIVGRVDDGDESAASVAPGKLQVIRDPFNAAPSVTIREPNSLTVLRSGDSLHVEWSDADSDSNATLTFALIPSGPDTLTRDAFVISPPIAEDPDGTVSDSAALAVQDVLPGLYDLVATIDDGRLVGTDRVAQAVRVLPAANNDFPRIDLLEPVSDLEVAAGGTINVRWTDSDENDNARISLLLDPDPGNDLLNGNEIVLAAGISEDDDGFGDQIALAIPGNVAAGDYRLVIVITDGATQVISRSPVRISVKAAPSSPGSSGTPGGGGGSGTNGGGGGGGPGGQGGGMGGGSSTEITTVTPAVEIVDHPGTLISIVVTQEEVPLPSRSRVFLSNLAYDGDFRLDVTPATGPLPTSKTYTLVVNSGLVPNWAWPRSFDVEVETTVDGVTSIAVSPRPIRIRQEVEIVGVRMLNYTCSSGGAIDRDPTSFVGVEWTWYGGGFDESESLADVTFWLSADGAVPDDDRNDSGHKLVAFIPASPNVLQVERVTLDSVRGIASSRVVSEQPLRTTATVGLNPGDYHLVGVLDGFEVERTVYSPFPTRIQICSPVLAESGGGPP